jgi:hypothetical protein
MQQLWQLPSLKPFLQLKHLELVVMRLKLLWVPQILRPLKQRLHKAQSIWS